MFYIKSEQKFANHFCVKCQTKKWLSEKCLKQSSENISIFLVSCLRLVLLNSYISCFGKQCRSKSVGFWRSQLICICTVCHSVYEFISTIWIKKYDWLTTRNGHGILIDSEWQGVKIFSQLICICTACHSVYEFISTIWIKKYDWLTTRNGHGSLIDSEWQGVNIFNVSIRSTLQRPI